MLPTDFIKMFPNIKKSLSLLGVEYPILGGAMSWLSERNLVSAISEAGCFGVIAASAMPPSLLDEEIKATKKMTQKPFGVNLVLLHPDIIKLIDICLENNVSHIILAGGIPNSTIINKIKASNTKVISFAPSVNIAKRLAKMGSDALVIEGMEAGGHIGPISTSVLAQEILPEFQDESDIPVFIAGGIGGGKMISSYFSMGASGCQLGTLFACTKESIAHPNFKKKLISSAAKDATHSIQLSDEFPIIPVRALKNKATADFISLQETVIAEYRQGDVNKKEAILKIEKFWAGALKKAVIDGDMDKGSLMAGQSVAFVKEELSVEGLVTKILDEISSSINNISH